MLMKTLCCKLRPVPSPRACSSRASFIARAEEFESSSDLKRKLNFYFTLKKSEFTQFIAFEEISRLYSWNSKSV